MNPPMECDFNSTPCVNCNKIYVGAGEMGRVLCMKKEEDSCKRGHMWCRKCWEEKYAENWENYCPVTMKKKAYRERRFNS